MLHIVSCVPSLSQLSAIQNRWIIGTCLEQLGFRVWGLRNSREEGVGRFGSGVVRTMVQPPEKASRAAASPVEAPFVPEAASAAERAAGWKNPPSRMQLMLWSGSKRHVFVGMLSVSVLATIPWLLLTSGKKHDSHADYMDRAEGARRSRLSTASAAVAPPTSS